MFKTKTAKGAGTQARILDAALRLFRSNGFDQTTVRDIAEAAGLSLGAAYHYFPGKDAIVLAYYAQVHDEHARRTTAAFGAGGRLRERLGAAFHAKFDILADDRPLMGALLRYTGDPTHPLSFLGPRTRGLQLCSIGVFAEAVAAERLSADLRVLTPLTLWALHMGLLLYFLYDDSPHQKRTRRLTDGALDLFVRALTLARLPLLRPVTRSVARLLDEAGLLPDEAGIEQARSDAMAEEE